MTVFENRVIADMTDKDDAILKQGGLLIQYDWFLFKRGNLDTDKHMRRKLCENEGRD